MSKDDDNTMPAGKRFAMQAGGDAHWQWAARSSAKGVLDSADDGGAGPPNGDCFAVRDDGNVTSLMIVDVTSRKSGITDREVQAPLLMAFNSAAAGSAPAAVIFDAHAALSAKLNAFGALAGACIIVAQLHPEGLVRYAAIGDSSVLLIRGNADYGFNNKSPRLNSLQHQGNSLTQYAGKPGAIVVEEGEIVVGERDMLGLASDGVAHGGIDLKSMRASWTKYRAVHQVLPLEQYVRKLDFDASLTAPHPDDRTIVVATRRSIR